MRTMVLGMMLIDLLGATVSIGSELSGNLRGALPAGSEPYHVAQTVVIPFGETLTLSAGSVLCFEPDAALVIEGFLVAEGEVDKRIVFSSCDVNKHWGGLRFHLSKQVGELVNRLRDVVVEYADRSSASGPASSGDVNHYGGGIGFEQSDAVVKRSIVRFNRALSGGGIFVGSGSAVSIEDSAIHSNLVASSNRADVGGGGVYLDAYATDQVTLARNVIALNRAELGNYENDEGGGGLYLRGGHARVLFNLFVGNSAGKAPGALIMGDDAGAGSTSFYGNIFVANHGGNNFEQVAVETRFAFEDNAFPDVWANNAGQFPFVAFVHRNALSKYVNYGHKLSTMRLITGADLDANEQQFVRETRRPAAQAFAVLGEEARYARICGSAVTFGPASDCNPLAPSMLGYLMALAGGKTDDGRPTYGAASREPLAKATPPSGALDPKLGELIRKALSVPEGSTAAQTEARLLDFASPEPPSAFSPITLTDEFAAAAEGSAAIPELLASLQSPRPPTDHRYTSPALWIAVFGHDSDFDELSRRADLGTIIVLLGQATRERQEDAAVKLFEARKKDLFETARRDLYSTLISACSNGENRLVAALLDVGLDPNLPLGGQFPLAVAVGNGQLSTVVLLLRHGANASPPRKTSDSFQLVPLFAALNWYHLGGGYKEMAELLIAAGADFDAADPGAPIDPLTLQSWVAAGFPTHDDRWTGVLANSLKMPAAAALASAADELKRGAVRVDPTIDAIRRWRGFTTTEIVARIDGSQDVIELTALYRILESRRFVVDDADRRVLYARYTGPVVRSVRLNYVMSLYQDGPVEMAVFAKGGEPGKEFVKIKAAPDLPFHRKFAVVIGVSQYKFLPDRKSVRPDYPGLVNLEFAAKDAADVATLVRDGALGKDWEVTELTAANASNAKVATALEAVAAEAKDDDLVMFFFSGHGMPLAQDPNQVYLLLQDSDPTMLDSTALRLRTLRDWVLGLSVKHAILLLDACHAGLINVAKGTADGLGYAELQSGQQGKNSGKIALTASEGGALSYEDPSSQNGLFTRFFLQTARGKLIRPRLGSFLTVSDVRAALLEQIPQSAKHLGTGLSQIPGYTLLEGGDLLDFPLVMIN